MNQLLASSGQTHEIDLYAVSKLGRNVTVEFAFDEM